MARHRQGGKVKPERKEKYFRADAELLALFAEYCAERSLIQERLLEACMHRIMLMSPADRAQMVADYRKWASATPRPALKTGP